VIGHDPAQGHTAGRVQLRVVVQRVDQGVETGPEPEVAEVRQHGSLAGPLGGRGLQLIGVQRSAHTSSSQQKARRLPVGPD
jgi:hypothetical protein